ncbi:hypothetical protein Q1695_013966 [Nippostrongylus brasiliensis]|nr:hypothetical protein Q1695_013966 [Nippostrongylus brasiliensis]
MDNRAPFSTDKGAKLKISTGLRNPGTMDDSMLSVDSSPGISRSAARRNYRRIEVLDDSSMSESGAEINANSFLSSDRDGDVSMRSEINHENPTDPDSGDDDDYEKDSFVVSDDYLTDDASSSFMSTSELERSLPTTKRILPKRSAKIDLNERLTLSKSDDEDESLEKSISLVQINDDEEDEPSSSSSRTNSGRCSSARSNSSQRASEKDDYGKVDEVADDAGSSTDDDFENYLKKLRGEEPTSTSQPKVVGHDDGSFVVSDSDVTSPAEDSESEQSDSSWSPNDDDDDNKKNKKRDLLDSLKKSFKSPSVSSKATKKLESDPDEHFLVSLSPDFTGKRHADAEVYMKKGIKNEKLRTELTNRLLDIFRRHCFKEQLPEFLVVKWNPRLCKTAGMCRNKSDRTCWIELSPKVCSTPDRVRDTLIHEMCHAAVWVVDGVRKEGHGPIWKKWAAQCMRRFQSLPVIARCHDYEIDAKFIYECGGCGQKVRRHTKSLNVDRLICGICKCRFTLQVRNRGKNLAAGDAPPPNRFAMFVKENYGKYKKPGVKHGEVMRTLSQLFKEANTPKPTTEPSEASSDKENEPLDISVLSIHD